MQLPSPVKILLGALPVAALVAAYVAYDRSSTATPEAQAKLVSGYAAALEGGPSECDVTAYGRSVALDGSSLWADTQQGMANLGHETNCIIDQFAMNNFLYLVGDGDSGHPRFMELAPWYQLLGTADKPVWQGGYSALSAVQLNKVQNEEEAGDGFELLDVNNQMTSYDIRINQRFFNGVADKGWYNEAGLNAAIADFNKHPDSGGIWLPPTDKTDQDVDSIEMKTAWRNFGAATAGACPSDIMHCETDASGVAWGLVGMHLVQKTTDHGEFIWATFEHVGNAPDCVAGGSSPIGKEPADPVNAGGTINVNKNISGLTNSTGWNYFNYATYTSAGGTGGICTYPGMKSADQPICLTTPEGASKTEWVQVNVCRTEPEPVTDVCANSMGADNADTIACLNQSVLGNFPSGLSSKWKYYKLVGMEWIADAASFNGAPLVGCFNFTDSDFGSTCPIVPPTPAPNPNPGKMVGESPVYNRVGSITMANTTMETWMQNGIVLNSKYQGQVTASDCFGCHQPQTASYQGDMSHIFDRITAPSTKKD